MASQVVPKMCFIQLLSGVCVCNVYKSVCVASHHVVFILFNQQAKLFYFLAVTDRLQLVT